MSDNPTSISATIKLKLQPWQVPNFAVSEHALSIPVADLDDDALEDLALAWVRTLYTKAGRTHCPFYKPQNAAP